MFCGQLPHPPATPANLRVKRVKLKVPYIIWHLHRFIITLVYFFSSTFTQILCLLMIKEGNLHKQKKLTYFAIAGTQVRKLKESDVLQKAYEELQERPDDNFEQVFTVG